jgi:ABC-type polysaccharide/polyol phosphate transport system ATPase subunit
MNAIEVAGVSKTYRIPHERQTTLVERVLSTFRPVPADILAALNDVSLAIPQGSFAGIIGPNGSGKSTLLKVMAGLLVPDAGDVRVNGTLAPLLELGLGFQNELTVRENVALYGAVLGYPRADMDRRVDAAIAFAELEQFRDAKLKSLSSGMLARLAFATALRADADVMLLDEVLAVGDAHFQQKCFAAFAELHRRRRTIVLVSHDLMSVQRFCERVYWFERGRLIMEGSAQHVINMYLGHTQGFGETSRWGDGRFRVLEGRLETEDGTPVTHVRAGARVVLRLIAEAQDGCEEPAFGFLVQLAGTVVYATSSALLGATTGSFAPGDRVELRLPFTVALANGIYVVSAVIADRLQVTIHDWVVCLVKFVVEGSGCGQGPLDLQARFTTSRVTSAPRAAVDPLGRAS